MKRLMKIFLLLIIALVCGVLLGLIATVPRKVGISEIQVSKLKISDEEALVVNSIEHPPWAQQNPLFRHEIYSRWPIVIRNGLIPGDYELRIWQGDHFETVGKVVVGQKVIDYQPAK